VKQNLPFERLVADLLQRDWRPRDVFSQTLLGGLVEYANAVVDAEAGDACTTRVVPTGGSQRSPRLGVCGPPVA
jgi:hypothetical protein